MSRKTAESETCQGESLWPEWSDEALDKETWTASKSGTNELFLDRQTVPLPASLKPHEWIRAKDLPNLNEPPTVFVPSSGYADLVANNGHLLHSEFARCFISALVNLQHCGRDGLEISGGGTNFTWNGWHQPWQGWMNVYSMNRAGRGMPHQPVVNPNGKYIVRLHFLGAWRRILVDDRIPVTAKMLPLLPRTSHAHELWPMLLSKALLKLASLTWTECYEIVDFHPVSCLTGWVCLQLSIGYMSPLDKWNFLRKYADHFEWQGENDGESQASRPEGIRKETPPKDTARTKRSRDTARTDATRRSRIEVPGSRILNKRPVILFLGLEGMEKVSSKDVQQLVPCWNHFIYVSQSRDVPLDPNDKKPPLTRWKLHRWLKWAIDEGVVDPIDHFIPIRSLKIVSPLRQYGRSVINEYRDHRVTQNIPDDGVDDNDKSIPEDSRTRNPRKISTDGDISFWADFNKLEPFVESAQFFYKLEYFQYTVKLSDRLSAKQSGDQKSETRRESGRGSRRDSPSRIVLRNPDFEDTYQWPRKMSRTRNEPLYIFVDSLQDKFFLVNFSTFQASPGEEGVEAPVLKSRKDCLVVERHDWFRRPEKSNRLISIHTAGTDSRVFELDRGRHLLRVFCRSEHNCFLTISSNTCFQIGDRRRMYQLMSTESEIVEQTARRISNAVSNACQAFGKANFPATLRAYYKSYLPPERNCAKYGRQFYKQIHDYFMEEQVLLIRRILPEDELPNVLRSLRIFFLNPNIGLESSDAATLFLKSLEGSSAAVERHGRSNSNASRLPREHRAATIIQSFFNMIRMKKYRKIHDPRHGEHRRVSVELLKFVDLFDYDKHESLANQLLRNLISHRDKLRDVYPCSRDFDLTLAIQECWGVLANVRPNRWLPIARLLVNPRVSETVHAAVDVFVDLPRYSVRVFKNETCQEMFRVVNNVAPTSYSYTNLGYTIFSYGWTEDRAFKELPYALNIVTVKGKPGFHSTEKGTSLPALLSPGRLVLQELSNNYIPNSGHFISKWIIRITKPCAVSFRLRTSYENVKIRFSVTDRDNKVLAQVRGTSVVILPMVYLDLPTKSGESTAEMDSNENLDGGFDGNGNGDHAGKDDGENVSEPGKHVYFAEALVLEDSWPLTRREWSLVSEFQVKSTGSVVTMKLSDSRSDRKGSRKEPSKSKSEGFKAKRSSSKQSINGASTLESPYWVLQVVTDYRSGLVIFQDRTKEKMIARMKEAWAKEDPESLQRGRELREAFLKKHEIRTTLSTGSLERNLSFLSEGSPSKKTSLSSVPNAVSSDICMPPSEERTLKAPPSLRGLPHLDFSAHEAKDESGESSLSAEKSAEGTQDDSETRAPESEEGHANFAELLENLMEIQKLQYRILYGRYERAFWERRADAEAAYRARNAFMDSRKSITASSTKTVAKRKSNTSKKT